MAAELDITKMLRDTYRKNLILELQQRTSKYKDYVTWLPGASGKRIEFNGRGTTEVDFRTQRFEEARPDELTFFKRSMLPVGIVKSMHYSDDDRTLAGDFSVASADFIEEMSNGFARKSDSLILGTVRNEERKRWEIAQGTGGGVTMPAGFYNGGAIGGILGPAYVGEHLNELETVSMEAATTKGEAYDGSNLDWENTSVIPADYSSTGTPELSGITIDKLLAPIQAMEERDALEDNTTINMAITPGMKTELMRMDEFKNRDFGRSSFVHGFYDNFLNIRFLVTKQIPKVDVTINGQTKEVYACPVWRTEDIVAAWWEHVTFDIVRPDRMIDEILIKAKASMGCTRRRHNTVMTVHCAC